MAFKYVNRFYTVSYLVLFLAISAVADISLDYNDDNNENPLRSESHIFIHVENCGTPAMRHFCYQRCGTNLACLFSECFCVNVKALSNAVKNHKDQKVIDHDVPEENSSVEENTGVKDFYEDEETEQEPPYNYKSTEVDEEIVDQKSALRHHIAHFCPNLNVARSCIRKCMKLGLPAFCGKDHNCYCRHNYQDSHNEPIIDPLIVENQFKDLYEKYFGQKSKSKAKKLHY